MINLTLFNRHWEKDFVYNIPKKRDLFHDILKFLPKKYIISIVGLRRTGKTTIMKQLIDYLVIQKIPRQNILFYSFDDPQELGDVINEYIRLSAKEIGKDKIYLFIDEIQKLKDWQDKIKIYYDNYPNLKFIISGSSSLFLKKSESLAGRIKEFELEPLSFREFLFFKEKQDLIENQKIFAQKLKEECESYILRQFIEIINEDIETINWYVESLARKIIFEDIPAVYPIEKPQILFKLLKIISSRPGMLIDYKNLASDLKINEKTISNYVDFMEQAYIFYKIYNFSKNLLTSEKKLKKEYLKTTSFCISENKDIALLIENCIITQTKAKFFWRENLEVDAIIILDKEIIPIEIKYKDEIKQREIKGIIKFIEKFKIKRGIIITKNYERKTGQFIYIPAWKFLLNKGNLKEILN